MDVRGKLVELIDDTQRSGIGYFGSAIENKKIADYLIRHGVTVQDWVLVEDRLPEDDSDVIAYLRTGEEGRIFPANYAKGVWFDCIFNKRVTETTTHWMPMPEPPKGE